MNLFDKIKLAWKLKTFVDTGIGEAKKMDTVSGKQSWKSMEFYFTLASQAGLLWGAVSGFVPPKWAAIISTVGVAVFTVARTIGKAIADIQVAKSTQSTVTTTAPVTTVTTPT